MKSLLAEVRLARPVAEGGFALDLALETGGHAVTAVLGESGAGKTTLLRCIAGLEAGMQGRIEFGGQTWWDSGAGVRVPCHRRRIGYVFERGRLFPHLDVAGNLGMAGRGRGAPEPAYRERILEGLAIGPLLRRAVDELSAGERQRVAIARALLSGAELILMDEPISALDHVARDSVMSCLESMRDDLRVPVLYVSHSVEEVARLADCVIVLDRGRVAERGSAIEVFADPGSFVSRSDNPGAIVECVVAGHDEVHGLTRLSLAQGGGETQLWVEKLDANEGQRVRLRIHARDVSIALRKPEATSILNVFGATVENIRECGAASRLVTMRAGGQALLARITRRSVAELELRPGVAVYAQVKSVSLTLGLGSGAED